MILPHISVKNDSPLGKNGDRAVEWKSVPFSGWLDKIVFCRNNGGILVVVVIVPGSHCRENLKG